MDAHPIIPLQVQSNNTGISLNDEININSSNGTKYLFCLHQNQLNNESKINFVDQKEQDNKINFVEQMKYEQKNGLKKKYKKEKLKRNQKIILKEKRNKNIIIFLKN